MIREDSSRLNMPKMGYYRETYKKSPRWNGSVSLNDKHLIIYCEQGLGDQIQFIRFVKPVMEKYPKSTISLHCSNDLHELLGNATFHVNLMDRDNPELPVHDYHIPSMSLPFALQKFSVDECYLQNIGEVPDVIDGFPKNTYKIGIAWEGNPNHSNNDERSCHLKYFKILQNEIEKPLVLFSVQKKCHNADLLDGTENLSIYGTDSINNMLDTAKLINSMDAIVSVDTSILHLAGTLKKPSWCLLSHNHDYRWVVRKWYQSVNLIKQPYQDEWEPVFKEISNQINQI